MSQYSCEADRPIESHKPNWAKEYFVDRAIGEAASIQTKCYMGDLRNAISVTPARNPSIHTEIIVSFKSELYRCVPILSLILSSPSREPSLRKRGSVHVRTRSSSRTWDAKNDCPVIHQTGVVPFLAARAVRCTCTAITRAYDAAAVGDHGAAVPI